MELMVQIYVGTSGWSYPTGEGKWTGHFYPTGRVDELQYYSRFFKVVEVNSSFYAPPNPTFVLNWMKKVPQGFLFTLKLWQKFTHPGMFKEATDEEAVISQADVTLFCQSLDLLSSSGKLGAVLAQFPPGFINDGYGRQILRAVIKTFGRYNLAVELRHCSWSDDKHTAELLREGNAAWVQTDEPRFNFSLAEGLPLTADWAYFRFHGRNAEMWWRGDNETRYKYLYSPGEIQELAGRVKLAAEKTRTVFAFFNNHWQGYAPRNARELLQALSLPHGPRGL